MSSRSRFGTIKRIVAVLIAIAVVLAAGIVVGQAPAIFGVEEEPEASITFEDQESDGQNVTIDEVSLSDGGFVVVTDGGDEPIAVSDYLEPGTHENVTVERDESDDRELVGQLTATVHQDTDDDESYTYGETDGEEDRPYLEAGFPVSDTATVTSTGDDDATGDSFLVESIDAPATATTNETIEVRAEISNPTEYTQQQTVEFRLDGAVVGQQVLELEGGASQEVTFQIDTSGASPGAQTVGVYTDADGELAEIELELHTAPSVTVVDANDDGVTVDAVLPDDGFVAVEADGTVIGTSDALEGGERANVSVAFDENASVDEDDELTAVLYEGEPGDVDAASPVEHEGEPVETTFTIAEARTDDAAESGDGEDGT